MIFLHPTLRSLTISCASTDYPSELLPTLQNDNLLLKSTALESLHLEECDILPSSLAILLAFPKALKSLRISEGVRYTPQNGWGARKHGDANPLELGEALLAQQESLESLSLSLGFLLSRNGLLYSPTCHLDLTSFAAIRYLELDLATVYLMTTFPRCTESDHRSWWRAPPHLECFKISRIRMQRDYRPAALSFGSLRMPLLQCIIANKAKHGVPSLKTMTYAYECAPQMELGLNYDHHSEFCLDEESLRIVAELSSRLAKAADVSLRLQLVTLPAGHIPPYLLYEEHPVETLLYDSTSTLHQSARVSKSK